MKSGELQMNLRRKRNTASYQNDDHHYNSYEQYEEVTKGGSRKESQSRVDHGNLAKILVDFINQINFNCRENKRIKDKEKKTAAPEGVPQPRKRLKTDPNSDNYTGPVRKNHASHHAHQEKVPEKPEDKKYGNKDLYRFKDQMNPNLRNLIPEAKPSQNPSAKVPLPPQPNILPNFNYMNFMNELGNQPFFMSNNPMNYANLSHIQSALPNLNPALNPSLNPLAGINFNINMMMLQPQFGDRIPPYQVPQEAMMRLGGGAGFGGMGNAAGVGHIAPGMNTLEFMSALQQVQQKDKPNKLFKRASFHVAIAYHIHLKKIQQKQKEKGGGETNMQIDPTYFAKRLREKKTEGKQDTPQGKSEQPSVNSKADPQPTVESSQVPPEVVPVEPPDQLHTEAAPTPQPNAEKGLQPVTTTTTQPALPQLPPTQTVPPTPADAGIGELELPQHTQTPAIVQQGK